MSKLLFADESGTHPGDRCYSIGALVIDDEALGQFNAYFEKQKERHGVKKELKWEDIRTSYGPMNLAIDLIRDVLRSHAHFSCIVVKKDDYVKWGKNKEDAFYTTYTLLLRHRLAVAGDDYRVVLDQRSDRYAKQHEVVEIVTNHMARQVAAEGRLVSVKKDDSRLVPGIQAIDMLTGAVNASHNRFLNPGAEMHHGKELLIERLAGCLGWDALHYDTWPDTHFNIWHFPQSWRATPRTMHVNPQYGVGYVTAEDILTARAKRS